MRIQVNGDTHELPDGLSVAGLLERLKIEPLRAAVERNKQLIRRSAHGATVLADGDAIEIVTLVGGG